MNKLKAKLKEAMLLKITKLKKQIKAYKYRVDQDIIKEQEYIDKINLLQDDARQLLLKLSKEERELWLKERNKKNERHTPKKK